MASVPDVCLGAQCMEDVIDPAVHGQTRRFEDEVSVRPMLSLASGPAAKRRRLSLSSCGSAKSRRAKPAATPQAGDALRRLGRQFRRSLSVGGELAFATSPLAALSDGPYLAAASFLGARDIARLDATCRLLQALNGRQTGPWHAAGDREFFGTELGGSGGFMGFDALMETAIHPARTGIRRGGWKGRYELFHRGASTFSTPFNGAVINSVEASDEVAYCECRLRTDLLGLRPDRGVYVEVEVLANADNLSLAVVDFEGGGRSSVTFSPETGAVLRERKVPDVPRAIEGSYIHLLPAAKNGRRFEGTMGIFLQGGHIAFFRRWSAATLASEEGDESVAEEEPAEPAWEVTGFCTDLRWSSGCRLSMCLAFRDEGAYNVRISRVDSRPPLPVQKNVDAYKDDKWMRLYGDDDHPLAI